MPTGRKKNNRSNTFQDILFLSGIILFTTILIIALYPGRLEAGLVDENFFITTIMTIPVIAGIYFIVISFRRTLNIESVDIRESIKKKMTLSFVFIAVLSAIPIVIVSSSYFGKNLAKMYSGSTMLALEESVNIAHDMYIKTGNDLKNEMESLRTMLKNGLLTTSRNDIEQVIHTSKKSGGKIIFFRNDGLGRWMMESRIEGFNLDTGRVINFYSTVPINGVRIDRIRVNEFDLICGAFRFDDLTIVACRRVSPQLKADDELFSKARDEYRVIRARSEYFESGAGSFLTLISIIIIAVAYITSLYISGNITKPIMELSRAARQIAMGNNRLFIKKRSNDELGLLIDTFNSMARQLEENQKVMFQRQKLEAWNEMARRLVHEIKNPLTPIRLSAERMRKLVQERNPRMESAVISGSETIISEVNALLRIVSNFNNFARMPEIRPELSSLKSIIDETVSLFRVYENVEFRISCADNLPEINLDRVLMRQALNNLITNAIHAMSEKGKINITAEAGSDGLYAVLRIRDNGPGVEEKYLDKIFDPGFTLGKTGTGLGLAIVEKIVLEHKGKIFCRRAEGGGAEFVITLPVNTGEVNGKDTDS